MMLIHRRRRLGLILGLLSLLAIAAGLIFYALREQIDYFYTPQQLVSGQAPLHKRVRLGGMVVEGSLQRASNSVHALFKVTDFQKEVLVSYDGILPDLFREKSGVVVVGSFDGKLFVAQTVLAKHDENYMPPQVSKMLQHQNAQKP